MTHSIWIEGVGMLATGVILSGFLFRDPRSTMKMTSIGLIVWLIYFSVLGAWSALVAALTALTRSLAGAFLPDRYMVPVVVLCCAILLLGWLVTPEGPAALFALASGMVKALAAFARGRVYVFRSLHIAGEAFMIPYAIASEALALVGSSMIALVVMISTLSAIFIKERAASQEVKGDKVLTG